MLDVGFWMQNIVLSFFFFFLCFEYLFLVWFRYKGTLRNSLPQLFGHCVTHWMWVRVYVILVLFLWCLFQILNVWFILSSKDCKYPFVFLHALGKIDWFVDSHPWPRSCSSGNSTLYDLILIVFLMQTLLKKFHKGPPKVRTQVRYKRPLNLSVFFVVCFCELVLFFFYGNLMFPNVLFKMCCTCRLALRWLPWQCTSLQKIGGMVV